MPRSRDLALIDRDRKIIQMAKQGYSYTEVGQTFGLTKGRICQIVQSHYEDVTDDAFRDKMRLEIEFGLEQMYALMRGPGRVVVSPGGKVVCHYAEDGSVDTSRPLYDEYPKADILKAILAAQERLSRSYALDRPKRQEREDSPEVAEALAWVEKIEARNRELEKTLSRYENGEIITAEVITAEAA